LPADEVAHLRSQWEQTYTGHAMPPPPPRIYPSRDALVAAGKEFAKKNGYELVIGHSARSQ
ncbi:hypothetical protein LTR16_010995, partial [Cryomyces antarcticus]